MRDARCAMREKTTKTKAKEDPARRDSGGPRLAPRASRAPSLPLS
jgi:hypothetical protein